MPVCASPRRTGWACGLRYTASARRCPRHRTQALLFGTRACHFHQEALCPPCPGVQACRLACAAV